MKILIADDESFVVAGLTRLICENIPHVEVVAADNGQSALALCEDSAPAPDLLRTDVSMPLMDGIELSQKIRARYPHCRIMIISGYADFQAARSAIELGALRYMLKPINHEEMEAYVRSVVEDLGREQAERVRRSNERLENLLVELHNHMLLDIAYRGAERIAQESGEYCAVRLVAVGTAGGGIAALSAALASAMESRPAPTYLIETAGAQATLLLCDFRAPDAAWLERLPLELESSLMVPVAVGVGQRCKTLESIHLSYRTAGMAVWRSYLAGGHAACFDDAVPVGEAEANRLDAVFSLRQEVRRMLDFYTLVPDEQQLLYCINTFMARLERINCPLSMKQLMCAELVADLLGGNYVPGLELDLNLERYLCLDFYTGCNDYAQLRAMMTRFIQLYNGLLEQISRSGSNRLILSIRSAIHADLRNASLSHVADTLNMSPSYISMIFKEKTGQNFKDYLLSTRMNRAKRLLRQGEPIYEIARQLGYEDAEHFSRRFRARFGLSPAAYRREGEDAGDPVDDTPGHE